MKINMFNRLAMMVLLIAMLFVSADALAQRGRGGGGYRGGGFSGTRTYSGSRYQPIYHFGGGVHVGGGYYAPRGSYHYYGPGYGAARVYYHPHYSYIGFGGMNYGYYNGLFYRSYGFGLHLTLPPLGIRIGVLPYGYYPFYFGPNPYYYYGGIFYSPYNDGGYQVVAPPLGALVPELPAGAKTDVINGQEFYEYYGTFYVREIRDNGETWFRVVGRNGRLETGKPQYDDQYQPAPPSQTKPYQQPQQVQPQPQQAAPDTTAPATGDLVSKLPDGCVTVTINGEQYFKSPEGNYYQQVIGDDNKVMYQIIDKATLETQP